MAITVRTNDTIPAIPDVGSVSATLFEQLGTTGAILPPVVFSIALAVGASDPTPNPLPDYE